MEHEYSLRQNEKAVALIKPINQTEDSNRGGISIITIPREKPEVFTIGTFVFHKEGGVRFHSIGGDNKETQGDLTEAELEQEIQEAKQRALTQTTV